MTSSGTIVGYQGASPGYWTTPGAAFVAIAAAGTLRYLSANGNAVGSLTDVDKSNPSDNQGFWRASGAGPPWTAVSIGTPVGYFSLYLRKANDREELVGSALLQTAGGRAIYWASPTATPVELAPPASLAGSFQTSDVRDINSAGVAVGSVFDGVAPRAVVWHQSVGVELPISPGSQRQLAYVINETGTIAGLVLDGSGTFRLILWKPVSGSGAATTYQIRVLTTTAVDGSRPALDECGRAVATREDGAQGVSWDGTNAPIALLPPAGLTRAQPQYLRASGVAVGTSSTTGLSSARATMWSGLGVCTP